MTGEHFQILIKGLKAVYSDPKFIPDQDAANVWYQLLKDIPYEVASIATQSYMQSEKFPPTPADIRRYATKITSPVTDDMSEIEAWSLVSKALKNGNYGAESEFAKLPPLIQQTLGDASRLREMAQLDTSEVETVEQSHFVRNYRAKVEAHKREMQFSEGVRKAISQSRPQSEVIEQHEVPQIKTVEEYEIPPEIVEELKKFKIG